MNETKKQKWLTALEYLAVAALPMLIFLVGMIIKGISPFGANSLHVIDFNDGLIPSYTGLWDFLHGKESFLIDWLQGAGGSNFASYITGSFLSPIALLVGIFPRSEIMFGVSMLIIIKLMLMNFTAYYCFRRLFPNVNKLMTLLFTLTWTFSGWTLVHFTNIGWLDIMILFPILILQAKKLVETGKNFWFVVILTYMLMLSYYITYMILVATVIIGLLYVLIIAKEKKKTASSLFYAIIISLLISMVVFIPSCVISLGAHRFSGTASGNPTSDLFSTFFDKLTTIIMFALPVVFFVRLMFTYKSDKRNVLFFMLSFLVCGIGILIEPINKMWHTGSYYCFPIRYGYILIMLLIMGSLYYLNKKPAPAQDKVEIRDKKSRTKSILLSIFVPLLVTTAVITVVVCAILAYAMLPYRESSFLDVLPYLLLFATTYGAIELCLLIKSKKLRLGNLNGGVAIFVLCLVEVITLAIGHVGNPYINTTSTITNAYNINISKLEQGYKLKDRESAYSPNFAKFVDYASLSSWIHISPEQQYQAYDLLGYNTHSTTLCSSGGTLLTDALLGNRYVLSREELPSEFYTKLDTFDYTDINAEKDEQKQKMYLYELNINFNLAYLTDVDLSTALKDAKDYVEAQNLLYKALYKQDVDIMTSQDVTITETEDEFILQVSNAEGKVAYLSLETNLGLKASVNGVTRPLYQGLNEIGFSEEAIDVVISKEDNEDITLSDLQKLKGSAFDARQFVSIHNLADQNDATLKVCGDKLNVTITNDENSKYVLIPYTYLDDMSATINGKGAKISTAFGSFILVEAAEGANKIVVAYQPKLFIPCLIITIVAVALFVIFTLISRKHDVASNRFVVWVGLIGACLLVLVVGALIYVKPLFDFFVAAFKGIFGIK